MEKKQMQEILASDFAKRNATALVLEAGNDVERAKQLREVNNGVIASAEALNLNIKELMERAIEIHNTSYIGFVKQAEQVAKMK
jgi:hypothetical protein